MIYFSEIRGKKIFTEDNIPVGILDDLIFLALETPQITKLVIKDLAKNTLIVTIDALIKINSKIVIKKNFNSSEVDINELFILRNLLDKQVIDLSGNKVVRVNDVAINDKLTFYIAGVDIGFIGILRQLKIEKYFNKLAHLFFLKPQSHFLSWAEIQPLELSRGKVILNTEQTKLKNLHPADLADYLEKTNIKNVTKIIDLLDRNLALKVIVELNPNYQIAILKRLGYEKTQNILSLMDPDEAVDVLCQFSSKRRDLILKQLEKKKKDEIEKLLKFKGTSIGEYLSTEFITAKPESTVSEVEKKIKKEAVDLPNLDYILITNDEDKLIGVVNLFELILQEHDTPIYKFMTQNVIVAHQNTPASNILRRLIKYHLYALPIIDDQRKIIGIVKRDDVAEKFIHTIK